MSMRRQMRCLSLEVGTTVGFSAVATLTGLPAKSSTIAGLTHGDLAYVQHDHRRMTNETETEGAGT